MIFPWSRGRAFRRAPLLAARKTARAPVPTLPLLLGLLLWVSALVVLNLTPDRPYSGLTPGQRAPVTVVAQVDFKCEDLARTELNRQQAANAVPPAFTIDVTPLNTASRALDKLVERLVAERERQAALPVPDPAGLARALGSALDLLGLALTADEVQALFPPGAEAGARDAIKKSAREVWGQGIVSAEERDSAFQGLASSGAVGVQAADGTWRGPLPLNELPLPAAALDAMVKRIPEKVGESALPREPLRALLKPWVGPNLVYDPRTTAEKRRAAGLAVEPAIVRVTAGTMLVEAGEPVTPQVLEYLQKHERRRRQLESPYDLLLKQIGNAGLLMGALIAGAGLLHVLSPSLLHTPRLLLLLIVVSLVSLGPTRFAVNVAGRTGLLSPALIEFVLPLALSPLLAVIVLGVPAALMVGVWNSLVMAILFDQSFSVMLLGLIVTAVATLSARDVRRRSRIYRAGVLVGLAEVLAVIAFAAVRGVPRTVLLIQAGTGLAGGMVYALLAILLIPLLEWAFRVTTNLTLLELCDLSHPLLQRLAMEAPGTYHHSMVVANLAQEAAQKIGANTLLVRAAAYFHDIGKLAKPEFFIENMRPGVNPHDALAPRMSSLIITSHVKEGLGLARRYRIPATVAAGIEQHHGNGLVSYFYHRARQQQDGGEGPDAREDAVSDQEYRYGGRRPQTREMAILALADAVEAAARSLEDPTPARIENLVGDIAGGKLRDGQFDECPLTLGDLAAIRRSFVFTLANMLHVRIAYPADETKSPQPAEPDLSEDGESEETDPGPGRPDQP